MQRILSGIQPTNKLHLGNYLGAIKNWVNLQNQFECFFFIVDLHAITVKQDPKILRENTLDVIKTYIALGVNPKKSIIFVQSDIKEHAELAWILNTITKISELERMTQFKDKSRQHAENINVGLFAYPVLMAADILLYNTNLVPVGEDQTQHLELSRLLANRFNQLFGDTFIIPEPFIGKQGARVMGLDDPTKKMSKGASSPNNYIALLDDPDVARKKIMKAVTDSGSEIKAADNKPALANLLTIYSLLADKTIKEIEKEYAGRGYADFKKGLAETTVKFLADFQKKFNSIGDAEAKKILKSGAEKARSVAFKKMKEIKEKIGLGF
ncbi:MAG: tryptophan--tRNA ligase [Patescibacteria group bacterium]|nr:tryptophan--tRNA ligase [Patescibacteria group bacterium]